MKLCKGNSKWRFDNIPDQSERVVVVTGANSGIGFQFTRHMVRKNARVVMACRDETRGREALNQIKLEFPQGYVEMRLLDLNSKESIHEFANSMLRDFDHLDILNHNAGTMMQGVEFIDGVEKTFVTNTFGPYLLTYLLIPLLEKTPGARVLWTSSVLHHYAIVDDWDYLNDPEIDDFYTRHERYNVSKALNIYFARRLAKVFKQRGSDVLSIPVHPGVAGTGVQAKVDNPFVRFFYHSILNPIVGQDAEMGSAAILRAATDQSIVESDFPGPGGPFQYTGWPVLKSKTKGLAKDEVFGERVWKAAEEWSGKAF
jgi:NAD(P)-dependent dehydrogenase (short-subunit alcohol dehydrogenase family)